MTEPSINSPNNIKSWQRRTFSTVWITYFAFYLCRYNMPIAGSFMCQTFGWTTAQLGMVFSSLLLMYAIGQFVNGQLADRFGSRIIASIGVLGSVAMNMAIFAVTIFASSNPMTPDKSLLWVSVFWGANGFFQAMGWTPMVRVMSHWFSSKNRGRVMGWLGTCYQFGAAFSWFLAFFIIEYYAKKLGGDWRAVFWVPAVIFGAVGILYYLLIRNTPEDVGLSPIEADDHSEDGFNTRKHRTIFQNIIRTLKNPYLWVIAITFFLLDVNRYGFVNWLPKYLTDSSQAVGIGGFGIKEVMKRIIHPLAGSAGAVIAGWATDHFFKGRRAPVIAILLALLGILSIIFPYIDPANSGLIIIVIALIGFCTYGPHILMVGHAAQDFGKKSGSAGAAGFIDGMGYIGASLAGWGAGVLITRQGYEFTFAFFGGAAILGALLVCIIWHAGPKTHTVD